MMIDPPISVLVYRAPLRHVRRLRLKGTSVTVLLKSTLPSSSSVSIVTSMAYDHHRVRAHREGEGEFAEGFAFLQGTLCLGRFVGFGGAVVEGLGEGFDTGVIGGLDCFFGGEVIH